MPSVVCQHCGAENPEGEEFCEVCDERLPREFTLFRKKGAGGAGEGPAQRARPVSAGPLSAAEEVRDMAVTSLSERDSRNAMMRPVRALESTGLGSGDQAEVSDMDPDARSVVEAVDSKLMELEVR